MQYVYQPSFLDATLNLSEGQVIRLLTAIEKFQHAIESNQWPKGLGISHLREDYFEFRVDIHTRVIYRRFSNGVQYVLYGSHDQVRRFLKSL